MDLDALWAEVLPEIRTGVTGVGVWTALNTCKPITIEEGTLVLGVPHESSELAGHLKMAATRSMIEKTIANRLGELVTLRVVDGITPADWETVKRRDAEAKKMREAALQRAKAETSARSNWDTIYEQLNRRYASIANKSLPQNRAQFYIEALAIVAEARKAIQENDDMSERNFARCLERIAQYTELPSALVAMHVLERVGK